jgi:hypothetical protein
MLPAQQRPAPVQVEGVEPVVVDGQCVLQVCHRVVPPAGHKYGLAHSLNMNTDGRGEPLKVKNYFSFSVSSLKACTSTSFTQWLASHTYSKH